MTEVGALDSDLRGDDDLSRVTAACALYPCTVGCPWVRIIRESGSVLFITPSGTGDGVYGFGGIPSR